MPKPGAKERIKQFLRRRVGKIVTAKELQAAAGNVTEWARRVRELRNDEGWRIVTHHDDSGLKPGEYRLDEPPPERASYHFAKPISKRTRAQVLERNGYTCQMCGAGAGEPDRENPGRTIRLHLGHIVDRSHGGLDDPSNLRALCSTCNQGAKNLTIEPPRRTWLLAQVRRATIDDQRAMLTWLKKKFKESEQ